jgi:tripartite-type tricarboxylate transporter receptor subunit TctC
MLKELDSVVLTADLPEQGLSAGDIGTVVMVHDDAGYEVEFVTLDGETLAMLSLRAGQVRAIEPREIAHVRAVG